MIFKTKSYRIPKPTYIRIAFIHLLKAQWWILAFLSTTCMAFLYFQKYWFTLLPLLSMLLYFLFWGAQFYGVTVLEESQLFFESLQYQISSKEIVVFFSSKQGMPIPWNDIKQVAIGKKDYTLFLSRAHFVHMPHRIFTSDQHRKFFMTLLQAKGLV